LLAAVAVLVHWHELLFDEKIIDCFTQLVAAVQSCGVAGLIVGSLSLQSVCAGVEGQFAFVPCGPVHAVTQVVEQ
jgi:hypothetical protein